MSQKLDCDRQTVKSILIAKSERTQHDINCVLEMVGRVPIIGDAFEAARQSPERIAENRAVSETMAEMYSRVIAGTEAPLTAEEALDYCNSLKPAPAGMDPNDEEAARAKAEERAVLIEAGRRLVEELNKKGCDNKRTFVASVLRLAAVEGTEPVAFFRSEEGYASYVRDLHGTADAFVERESQECMRAFSVLDELFDSTAFMQNVVLPQIQAQPEIQALPEEERHLVVAELMQEAEVVFLPKIRAQATVVKMFFTKAMGAYLRRRADEIFGAEPAPLTFVAP